MALQVEKGVFTANTGTGDQTVSLADSSLTPKLLILWATYETAEGVSFADGIFSLGLATRDGGSTQQGYICLFNDNGAGTSATIHDIDVDAVFKFLTSDAIDATATDAQATLVSFGAGQFVINWSNAPASAVKIHYEVWGGSSITAARLTKPTVTTGAGTQDVTVAAGFGQPDLILFASHGYTDLYAQNDARLMMGFGRKPDSAGVSMHLDFEDASTTMSLGSWYASNRCMIFYTAAVAKDAEASLSASASWPTDGYQLTWNDTAGFAFHFLSLAIKGDFLSALGTSEMLTAGTTQDLDLGSGTPKGMLLMANMTALTDNTINSSDATLGGFFVGGSDGTNEGGAGILDLDGNTSSRASRYHTESKAIQRYLAQTTVATLDAEADVSVIGTAFQLNYNNLAAAGADFIWLVVGEAAGPIMKTISPASVVSSVQTLDKDKSVVLASGTVVSSVQALDKDKSIVLAKATEVDTARTVSFTQPSGSKNLTPAVVVSTVQALNIDKTLTLGAASVSMSARTLIKPIAKLLGVVSTSMAVQGLDKDKAVALVKAQMVTSARTLIKPIQKLLGTVTSTGTAQALNTDKAMTLVKAIEVDTARVMDVDHLRALGIVTSPGAAQPLDKDKAMTLVRATEVDTSRIQNIDKIVTLVRATSITTATDLSLTGPIRKTLGIVINLHASRSLDVDKRVNFIRAQTVDTARPLVGTKPIVKQILTAITMNVASSLGITHPIQSFLTPAVTSDLARVLSFLVSGRTWPQHSGFSWPQDGGITWPETSDIDWEQN